MVCWFNTLHSIYLHPIHPLSFFSLTAILFSWVPHNYTKTILKISHQFIRIIVRYATHEIVIDEARRTTKTKMIIWHQSCVDWNFDWPIYKHDIVYWLIPYKILLYELWIDFFSFFSLAIALWFILISYNNEISWPNE